MLARIILFFIGLVVFQLIRREIEHSPHLIPSDVSNGITVNRINKLHESVSEPLTEKYPSFKLLCRCEVGVA